MTAFRLIQGAVSLLVHRPARFRLLSWAAFHVTVASAAMRFASLPQAVALASDGRPGLARFSLREIENAVDTVLNTEILWLKPNCWKRAMAMRRLLAENGRSVDIVFGVRHAASGVTGHAWLEGDGEVFGALDVDPPFTPYFRHPPGPASKPSGQNQ